MTMTRHVHPTVRLDYLVRLIAIPLGSTAALFALQDQGRITPTVLVAAALWAFVWPHAAFFMARSAADTKSAELRNLLFDSLFVGLWTAVFHFTLFPAVAVIGGSAAGNLSVGGPRFTVYGLLVTAAGMLIMAGVIGAVPEFTASFPVSVVSGVDIILYMLVFAYHARIRTQKSIVARRQLEENSALLAVAKKEADSANEAKSAFLANVSHELRTPLNAIIGYSEMLMEEAEDDGDQGRLQDLRKINVSGKHLLELINEVLDLSKIEAGKMEVHVEAVEIGQLINDVAASAQPLAARNDNQFRVIMPGGPEIVRTDPMRLRQVLLNLLSNACKFTKEGTITLTVTHGEKNGEPAILFGVSDTGIGLTPEQQARLFQPFVQAETTTSVKYGGTGLGLALSRRFCQMLGGDIEIDSTPGEGSTFTAWLPLAAEREYQSAGV
jgi:signal transduction histidine kinase